MSETTATWTVARVAAELGVSVQTLHSWERRYGVGPTDRTVGGHRRYTPDDVATLHHMQKLIKAGAQAGAAARHVRSTPDPDDLRAAVELFDSSGIIRQTRLLIARFGTEYVWATLLVPLLQEVGGRWLDDRTGIACEHLLTDALLLAFQENTAVRFAGRQSPRVILAATANESHTLPLYAAASGFAEKSVSSRVLGTLPTEAVIETVRRLRPEVVLVWSRSAETASQCTLEQLASTVRTVAAGPGWPTDLPEGISVVRDLKSTLALV